jgi:hypothetical protein
MGCYFLLIEEELRVRPPHGFFVLGDGRREKIDNTPELREWVLKLADEIRAGAPGDQRGNPRGAEGGPVPEMRDAGALRAGEGVKGLHKNQGSVSCLGFVYDGFLICAYHHILPVSVRSSQDAYAIVHNRRISSLSFFLPIARVVPGKGYLR